MRNFSSFESQDIERELLLLSRAAGYMELLSQGRDPLSCQGEKQIPADSVLCHENLRKCFGYTARMLRIETDYLKNPSRDAKLPNWFTEKNVEHTAEYIDKLAQGRNPLTKEGEALPSDPVLNDRKMSKCFQYIAQVLRRQAGRIRELPDAETLPINDVMRGICRELGFTGNLNFLNAAAHEWLVQKEYITQTARADRGSDYTPTPDGKVLGMSAAEFSRGSGKTAHRCLDILCGEQAQQFLRDSAEQILDWERRQWEPLLECLVPDWHSRAACFQEPDSLLKLITHINKQLPLNLPRKLSTPGIFAWMHKNGLIKRIEIGRSRPSWGPTEEGEKLGIWFDFKRKSSYWDVPAQQFVLDNLNRIVMDMASGNAYRMEEDRGILS